jgi:hypothetical protein
LERKSKQVKRWNIPYFTPRKDILSSLESSMIEKGVQPVAICIRAVPEKNLDFYILFRVLPGHRTTLACFHMDATTMHRER